MSAIHNFLNLKADVKDEKVDTHYLARRDTNAREQNSPVDSDASSKACANLANVLDFFARQPLAEVRNKMVQTSTTQP
jgi:hypothetical protein